MDRIKQHPVVGVTACQRTIEGHGCHMVVNKYITALVEAAGVDTVLLPALETGIPAGVLARLDGICLTGSYSNVEPHHYGRPPLPEDCRHDPARDGSAFSLIRQARELNLPMLGICRGFQEMNVAYGGSLYHRLQDRPGMLDHREPEGGDTNGHYHPAHDISLNPLGLLARISDLHSSRVNSLHQQGIDRLGQGLTADATAPDGLIEAISDPSLAFALGVQWHPEWQTRHHPLYRAIFTAFGEACAQHQRRFNA
ncbi:gamma-glutamyl-gamma-aminobutyrate hydrolase family protein [Zobellella aerophila]